MNIRGVRIYISGKNLLYKNGYSVGKYISIERQIEKTKDRYYDVLESSDIGWHEEKNDPIPFIRYMLMVILACYTRFEERIGIIAGNWWMKELLFGMGVAEAPIM